MQVFKHSKHSDMKIFEITADVLKNMYLMHNASKNIGMKAWTFTKGERI